MSAVASLVPARVRDGNLGGTMSILGAPSGPRFAMSSMAFSTTTLTRERRTASLSSGMAHHDRSSVSHGGLRRSHLLPENWLSEELGQSDHFVWVSRSLERGRSTASCSGAARARCSATCTTACRRCARTGQLQAKDVYSPRAYRLLMRHAMGSFTLVALLTRVDAPDASAPKPELEILTSLLDAQWAAQPLVKNAGPGRLSTTRAQ